MLPCYANIKNIEKCTLEGGFSINLKEYLKRYLNAIENGKEELFIAFK